MGIHRLGPAALLVIAVMAAASPGCNGEATNTSTGTTQPPSSSSSGSGGAGGESGSGGGAAADNGAPATDFVSAGEVSKSANYKMVHTLGQSTQNQGKTTSPGYRLQGGLNGANGSSP